MTDHAPDRLENAEAPAMGSSATAARGQEDLLRLLDTRMACLLVDRPGGDPLRHCLEQLRERMSREPLDRDTLTQVEALVRGLGRGTAAWHPIRSTPGGPPTGAFGRSKDRLRLAGLVARAISR